MTHYFKWSGFVGDDYELDYIEFDGENPSRQVTIRKDIWSWASEDYHSFELVDQPLSSTDLTSEHGISKEEFERIWEEALKRIGRN